MKRAAILLLICVFCFVSGLMPGGAARAEEDEEGLIPSWMIPEGCTWIKCPPVNDTWMTDDEDMLLLMRTLREWWYYYYDTPENGEPFRNNDCVLFLNPFIFETDRNGNQKTIYCTCYFDTDLVYEDAEKNKTLLQADWSFLALSAVFEENGGEWTVTSVNSPEPEEELIPDWGVGTQGMNGVTDEMILMMDEADHYERMEEYIRKYLEHTGMEDITLDREN